MKEEKVPIMGMMGGPIWCHHHASKMQLMVTGLCNDFLILQGSAAELNITQRRNHWLVNWRIIQSSEAQTKGQVEFSDEELMSAFGLSDFLPNAAEWLIEQYGGTVAKQGKFIRFKEFLNIPCPGTGHDGDPNISIIIDEKMKKAVKELVYHCR